MQNSEGAVRQGLESTAGSSRGETVEEAAEASRPLDLITNILGAVTLASILVALYLVFVWAPTEKVMGDVQRIFYFHVPSAWVAFVAFFVVFIGSVVYLRTGSRKWDILAYASAEIGVVFTTIVLVTGPIWGKVAWGTWWTWDPRLTTSLILWLIYVAYLMLRSSMPDPARRARLAAVFGIVGFIDVPIVFMSIRWWRTIHPVVVGGEGFTMDPAMVVTLMVSLAAFSLLFIYLLIQRMSLESLGDEIEGLKQELS